MDHASVEDRVNCSATSFHLSQSNREIFVQ